MRRGRILFILAFVIILGLVGILLVWNFVLRPASNQQAQATPTPIPVQVVYLTQNVAKGTKLDNTMVAAMPWPQDAISPGMFMGEEIGTLEGRVVKYDIQAGMPVMDTMLLTEGEQIEMSGSAWALNIPPGMVAISIPAGRLAGLTYGLRPGDHVNVIASMLFVDTDTDFQTILPNYTGSIVASGPPDPATGTNLPLTVGVSSLSPGGQIDPETGQPIPPQPLTPGIYGKTVIDPVLGQAVFLIPSEGQRPRMVSHMFLQDAVVLQVGEFPLPGVENAQPTPTPEGGAPPPEGQPAPAPIKPDVVTLVVRPQDAVSLNYLMLAQTQSAVQLSLVLRSANDASQESVLPVTLQFLLEQYQIPVPARLPYSLNPRIDLLAPPQEP